MTTPLPTVVYPTLSPTATPTELPGMVCETRPIKIVCRATDCAVRNEPKSGGDNIAYTMPNQSVLQGQAVCVCPACAPLEQKWFYLGATGSKQFWAIQMDQVWEEFSGE